MKQIAIHNMYVGYANIIMSVVQKLNLAVVA